MCADFPISKFVGTDFTDRYLSGGYIVRPVSGILVDTVLCWVRLLQADAYWVQL